MCVCSHETHIWYIYTQSASNFPINCIIDGLCEWSILHAHMSVWVVRPYGTAFGCQRKLYIVNMKHKLILTTDVWLRAMANKMYRCAWHSWRFSLGRASVAKCRTGDAHVRRRVISPQCDIRICALFDARENCVGVWVCVRVTQELNNVCVRCVYRNY